MRTKGDRLSIAHRKHSSELRGSRECVHKRATKHPCLLMRAQRPEPSRRQVDQHLWHGILLLLDARSMYTMT